MLNIVLFGAPGCGKGTQAARLKEKYGIDHVSTGNVIREEIARGTKLGKEMESYITTGRLAPDQVVIDMIADYIAAHKHAKGNIFDGFPRTTHQAEEFDRMLSEQGLKVDVMIYMDVPEEELVKRILLRGERVRASGRRFGGGDPRPYQSISRTDGHRRGLLRQTGKIRRHQRSGHHG